MDRDTIALSAVAAAESAHAYSSFLPSTFTVKAFTLDSNSGDVAKKVAQLRSGYLPATIFSIALGTGLSLVARSWAPVAFSAVAAAGMVTLYERNLPAEMRLNPIQALLAGEKPQPAPAALQVGAPGPSSVGI